MRQNLLDLTQKTFRICKEAKLVEKYDDLFTEDFVEDFEKKLVERKAQTLKPRHGISFDESLWDEEYEAQVLLNWRVLDYSLENKNGMVLDWRELPHFAVESVLELVPEAKIKYLGEKQSFGDWFNLVEVNGETISLPVNEDDLVIDQIVNEVNKYLEKVFGAIFLSFNDYDDHYYILVKKESVDDMMELGFNLDFKNS